MSIIKQICDQYLGHLIYDSNGKIKVSSRLCEAIIKYDLAFVTKNPENVDFFGGALICVHRVVWNTEDVNSWVDNILQVDEIAYKKALYDIPPPLHPKDSKGESLRKVGLNYINVAFPYLLHGIINDVHLDKTLKEKTAKSLIRIMHYKFITSLIFVYCKLYLSDRDTAEAAFNQLDNKFDIKRLGSWKALIDDRADVHSSKGGLHYRTLKEFNNDDAVIYFITDMQTRIRKLIQTYYNVLVNVSKSKSKIISTSSVLNTDEGLVVKDLIIKKETYLRYIKNVITDRRSLIKDEIMLPLKDLNPSVNLEKLYSILDFISKNPRDKEIQKLCDDLLVYTFSFLTSKKIKATDISSIVDGLKNMLVGSKIKDPAIISLREQGDKVVRRGAQYSRSALISTERTVLLLYLVIRTLTMNHYK